MQLIDAETIRDRLSIPLALETVRAALLEQAHGRTRTSAPPLLQLDLPDRTTFQAKGAQVGGMIGLRIAGERAGRHVDEGRRLLLYELDGLTPVALLDERDLYRFRVAAQIAVAVERLRPAPSTTLTVFGAGRLARTTIAAIQHLVPFERVLVRARSAASTEAALAELRTASPGEFAAAPDADVAVATSDVVLTLTSASEPVVSGAGLSPGTLVVSAGGGWECDAEVYRRSRRLVVDDWQHCVQVGDLAVLSRDGVVRSRDVSFTLAAAMLDARWAACASDEIVVVVAQGMTILDVALAAAVLEAS